jgi:prevent-host-death family protein
MDFTVDVILLHFNYVNYTSKRNKMNISLSKDIEPVSEFRKHASEFMQRIKEDQRPIVLTQHGKSAAILLNVEEYERLTAKLEMLEDILQAKRDVDLGKTYSLRKAEQRIEAHTKK